MPFVNESQRKACFTQYKRDVKAGRIPSWDCYEWMESRDSDRKSSRDSDRKSSREKYKTSLKVLKQKLSPKKMRGSKKIYTGSRGGKYVIYKGRKVYI